MYFDGNFVLNCRNWSAKIMFRKSEESKLKQKETVIEGFVFIKDLSYITELSLFLVIVKPVLSGFIAILYWRSAAALSATGTSGYGVSKRLCRGSTN